MRYCLVIDGIRIFFFFVIVNPSFYFGFFAHTLDEEQAGCNHTDFDGNNQIKYDCQYKSSGQDDDITLRCCFAQMDKGTPATHIVSNHEQDRCNGRHGDEGCIRHQYNKYEQKDNGMYHTGDRGTSAVLDVGSRSGNGTCSRDTTE